MYWLIARSTPSRSLATPVHSTTHRGDLPPRHHGPRLKHSDVVAGRRSTKKEGRLLPVTHHTTTRTLATVEAVSGTGGAVHLGV